jgi:hypothetical protein
MGISSLGETNVTVRASAPDLAPRLSPFHVRRVADLAAEARSFRTSATASYASIASDIDRKKGWKVALDGTVLDTSSDASTTVFLLDTKSGCAQVACVTRVRYGGHLQLASGERVSVYGHVHGAVDGPRTGTQIPEVLADFVVENAKGRR